MEAAQPPKLGNMSEWVCPDCADDPATCLNAAAGYPFCYGDGCREHHREPVAPEGERCPVDLMCERWAAEDVLAEAIEVREVRPIT